MHLSRVEVQMCSDLQVQCIKESVKLLKGIQIFCLPVQEYTNLHVLFSL